MTGLEILRFAVGALLTAGGLFVIVTGMIGNFKFRYVLSRMHAAGLGDTLGLLLTMLGLIVLHGFDVFSVKLLVLVALFWTASPVASHMIMKMEIENGSGAKGPEGGIEK